MENTERKVYQPKLGDNNRYENAQSFNRELAKQINKDASEIVNNAMSVLEKVQKNPSMKYFHDQKTGGKWMAEWLSDQKKHIVQQLYGVAQLDGLIGIPKEVENFVRTVYQTVER